MKTLKFEENVKVFGMRVPNFPYGISDAFDALTNMLPPGDDRPFYGISECTQDEVVYIAAALETFEGEAERYRCNTYFIEKGEYLSATIKDWPSKIPAIKETIGGLLEDERADATKPCVEVYKSMNEMLCLVKVKQATKEEVH